MPAYVIAGVTGHVGSVVANELLAHGKEIKAIVRDEGRGAGWRARGADLAVGSLDDASFLSKTLAGAAGFFAMLPPNESSNDYFNEQHRMADAIAAAVKKNGVPHVVMLSSLGAELPGGTGPIQSLHYLENALRATGTKLIAIRAAYFQENIAEVIEPARQQGVYPNFMPSDDFAIPMVASVDIGRLAASLLTTPPAKSEVVDLLGPGYSARQLAEKLSAALGKPIQVVTIPSNGHVEALTQVGLPRQVAEIISEMYRAIASGVTTPKGDRLVNGTTTIDKVLLGLIEPERTSAAH